MNAAMPKITAGLDMGARSFKLVLLETLPGNAAGETPHLQRIVWREGMFPESLDFDAAAELIYANGLKSAGLEAGRVARIVATGAARKLARFADEAVTEVASGARGAAFLFPNARTVIDVGAEEARAIRLQAGGRVADFAANEKCAAGAGAFAESMARALQLNLKDFGEIALKSSRLIPMNAQCTVFAESEVVSLIHAATPQEDIARAVLEAVASRVCAMARRAGIEDQVVLVGGMAHNPGFVKALREALAVETLHQPEWPEYVCALGAALIAASSETGIQVLS